MWRGKKDQDILISMLSFIFSFSPPFAPFYQFPPCPCLFSTYICISLPLSASFFLLFAHTLLFPHTGSLIQVPMSEKGKITRGRLGSLSLKKEGERQCFLFSKHLIICTRGSGGKLHLTKVGLRC